MNTEFTSDEKIKAILNWATENPRFNTDWVLKVQGNLERFGSLTEKQEIGINNIVTKCKIDVEMYA